MLKTKARFLASCLGVTLGLAGLSLFGGISGDMSGAAQAQSLGGAVANRAAVGGSVRCFRTSAHENAFGATHSNAVRAARGLGQVAPDVRLAEAAARHACDMARRDRMTHVGSRMRKPSQRIRATGYRQSIVAENIGKGFDSADKVLNAWVDSDSHLSNILLPQVEDFGIGRALSADGRTVYWAAVYAGPR